MENKLSNIFKSGEINKSELLILYIIKENEEVKLNELLSILNYDINVKNDLKNLEKKNLIKIDYKLDKITLNIREQVQFSKNKLFNDETSSIKNDVASNVLTVENLDKIRVMLNREVKNYELEIIKQWIKNYSFNEIEEALYKGLIKNIDNFNYFEKILINNETSQKVKNKVTRKFDFFK